MTVTDVQVVLVVSVVLQAITNVILGLRVANLRDRVSRLERVQRRLVDVSPTHIPKEG